MSSSNGRADRRHVDHLLTTTVQTPESSQTTLLITPSFVTASTATPTSRARSPREPVGGCGRQRAARRETGAAGDHGGSDDDVRFPLQQISTQMWTQIAGARTTTTAISAWSSGTLSAHSAQFVAPKRPGRAQART